MTVRRMRFTCWVSKADRHIHTEYVTRIAFPRPNVFANVPQWCIVRKLSVLVHFEEFNYLSLTKIRDIQFSRLCLKS